MTTTRTRNPACCPRCQGSGIRLVNNGSFWTTGMCDHTFQTDVTGLTDDEQRILELESKLSQCAATCEEEARKAREAALEEAARVCEATGESIERYGANCGYGETHAAAIRALKAPR